MRPDQSEWLETLYRQYFNDLLIYAAIFIQKTDLAEEIVQDTFHEACKEKHLSALMDSEEPFRWLKKTVWNKCQNAKRFQFKMKARLVSLDESFPEYASPPDPTADAGNCLSEQEIMEKVQSALSAEELYILEKIVFQKAPHKQIAQELGISVAASQKRLERIRTKLAAEFPEHKNKK